MSNIYSTKLYQRCRGLMISIIDLSLVLFSYVFSFFYDRDFYLYGGELHITKAIIVGMICMLAIHALIHFIYRTHKSLWAYTGVSEVIRFFFCYLTCLVVMWIFSDMVNLFLHKNILIMAELMSFLLSLGVRLGYRSFRRYALDSERVDNCLIVGAGSGGYLMMSEIYRNSQYPFNVVGFLDDNKSKGTIISGKKVLGTIDQVQEVCDKYHVKQIFIAINRATKDQKQRIIDLCAATSVNTKIMRFEIESEDKEQQVHVDDIQIEDLLERPSIDLKTEEIGSYLSDKVVCVTGAGGSIGSELCRQIISFSPKELVMVDINENTLYMLKQEFMRKQRTKEVPACTKLVSLIISIREREEIFKLMQEYHPDVVFHAAAHKHVPLMEDRPMEAIRNNVFGTKNVIDACIANQVQRFIMISTDKAVNPTNVMGATKRMTELIMQSRENTGCTKMAAVRFGNVLGSSGSVIPIFKEQIKQGGPVTLTHREIRRYFMTIPEAAQLVLQAGYYAHVKEIFVLDMGKPVKILDLAEKMIHLAGYTPYKDIDIEEIGLRPGEKMFEELALEIEKCHKTDNNLIFVHEPIVIQQADIDNRIKHLADVINHTDDIKVIKKEMMEAIHE